VNQDHPVPKAHSLAHVVVTKIIVRPFRPDAFEFVVEQIARLSIEGRKRFDPINNTSGSVASASDQRPPDAFRRKV